jgi:hypothetical protein
LSARGGMVPLPPPDEVPLPRRSLDKVRIRTNFAGRMF